MSKGPNWCSGGLIQCSNDSTNVQGMNLCTNLEKDGIDAKHIYQGQIS